MAEGQDDARIAEIRARYAGLEKLLEDTTGQWDRSQLLPMVSELAGAAKTIPYLLERLDALTAERDVLRVERDIARRVEQESSAAADAWQAEAVKVRAERDALRARAERAESALLEILREAAWEARLTEWRKHSVTAVGTQPTPQEACREVRAIARAALANAIEREAAS